MKKKKKKKKRNTNRNSNSIKPKSPYQIANSSKKFATVKKNLKLHGGSKPNIEEKKEERKSLN